ncbi:iron-containing redox enzyme family protein [Hyalangium rubrum]|uniref:Iron-containing redox enzyme family protein n=1 Tax=Hyalangium rubrum TaxID=3103134 RepID=A0ABU5H042_9BACT|nr:iron-containing redox enzyme family protein [Hyalangium sp. s54d21]MDY7226477.1 iron-containing redox enzyme family protein [Hyalangium sp. s54d21]
MNTRTQTQTGWTDMLEQEARTLLEELDAQPEARRLFHGTIDTEGYTAWLAQTYHYVRWTTPLLERAGRRMKRLGQHPALAELLLHKAAEERGHERWLLADLKNLGRNPEEVERTEPCPAVVAYVAWNRFTSEAGSPTAFLGTAYVLEYLSVYRAGAAVEQLLERGAIPNIHKAVTFLRGHAGEDISHVAELNTVLLALTEPSEQAAILLSARATRALYLGLFPGESAR